MHGFVFGSYWLVVFLLEMEDQQGHQYGISCVLCWEVVIDRESGLNITAEIKLNITAEIKTENIAIKTHTVD